LKPSLLLEATDFSGIRVERKPCLTQTGGFGRISRPIEKISATEGSAMDFELLDKAHEKVPNVPLLVNMVSLRVREINNDVRRPLLVPKEGEDTVDTVLREIIEGKLTAEVDYDQLEARTNQKAR
ncbi:MAG: DNA-directed RNA polymerase subunit omega, partial [Kiritimatiellia bacterium]